MDSYMFMEIILGIISLIASLFFVYYSVKNTFSLKGERINFLRPTGAILIFMMGLIFAMITIKGALNSLYKNTALILFLAGVCMILIQEVYSFLNFKRFTDMDLVETLKNYRFGLIRLFGIFLIIVLNIPLMMFFLKGDIISPIITSFLSTVALLSLAWSEYMYHLAIEDKTKYSGEELTEMALQRDDLLALKISLDITNTYLKEIRDFMGEKPLRGTLSRYFQRNPVLFEGTDLDEDGTIQENTIMDNIENLHRPNRVSAILTVFTKLYLDLIELLSTLTSRELAETKLSEAFLTVRDRYDDHPIFARILKTLPEGVLEEEKLDLMTKKQLEREVMKRTSKLSEAFLRAREAEREMTTITEAMVDPLLVVDEKGKVELINPAFTMLFEYNQSEMKDTKVEDTGWFNNLSENKKEHMKMIIRRAIKFGEKGPWGMELPRKFGKNVPVTITAGVIDRGGDPRSIVLVIRDITSLKRSKREVEVMEKGMDSFIDGIAMTDMRGRIIYANESFIKMVEGGSWHYVMGEDIGELTGNKEIFDSIPTRVMKEGEWSGEIKIDPPSGLKKDILLSTSTIKNENEDSLLQMYSLVDITGKKRAEEWEGFLHSLLRHDVGNKVQIVQGYLELMDGMDIGEDGKQMIDKALKSIKSAGNLINRVRMMREAESQEFTGSVNPYFILGEVINIHKKQAEENGIEIRFEGDLMEEKVKSGGRGGALLESIFTNLIDNAIKHSDGSVIKVFLGEQDEWIKVTVEDDGKGIPNRLRDRIFESGFMRDKNMGSGLGLRLAKGITESLGGEIKVYESDLGGAKFVVKLKKITKAKG
ncbi:MAG: PAS domain-containing sensor histidine kinase [Thermoplasmatota archaeon]